MTLAQVAHKYIDEKKLSVIPINDKKQPLWNWQIYQERFMNHKEIEESFKTAAGIGVVCGKISGGRQGYSLCVIDMDCKYFDDHITYQEVLRAIPKQIRFKLLISQTVSGGYHLFFRTPLTGKNQKFAMRETSAEERKQYPNEKVKVLIENRFEGGYVCAFPTEGYKVISKIKEIPYLTEEEHESIFTAMASFNRVTDENECYEKFAEEKKNKFLQSPFDSANERMDVLGLLMAHGYSVVGNSGGDEVRVKRSGNVSSTHSGYFKKTKNRYVNFSTSGLMESGKSYSASELYCILEKNGNWSEAYKGLLASGYGVGVDLNKKVREFVQAFRDGDLEKILKLHFGATKVDGGYQINGQIFKIK